MTTNTNTNTNETRLSMYAFASVVSTEVGRRVREQQLYQYRAKDMIKLGDRNIVGSDGKVSQEDADAWAKQFATRQVERATKKAEKANATTE